MAVRRMLHLLEEKGHANAGQDVGIVCSKVAEAKGNNGYNALTNVYEDLVKAGVIDRR